MAERYWVVGGEYTDTKFTEIAGGGTVERHGPHADYAAAKDEWARLSWAHIDDAHVRYTIETETPSDYWVIGGEYTDTGFTEIAGGGIEQRLGPFESYQAAQAEWSRLSWQHIDDAHVRYRIDHV